MLKLMQQRPGMYLWERQIVSNILSFVYWYQIWVGDCWHEEELHYELFYKFQDFIVENTIRMDNRTDDCWMINECLLKVSNGDEKIAFTLFFKLLDKFIEEEGIEIENTLS